MIYNKGKISLIVFPSNQADSYLITFCICHNMNAHTIVHLINDVEPTVTPMLMQAVLFGCKTCHQEICYPS